MSKTQYWMGQKILFSTVLFGKPYVWLQDGDGVIYLARLDENGSPRLT